MIMPEVVTIVPVRDGLRCIDIIGRSRDLERVRLVELDLLRHRIILERA